jgi:hypothetical protein
MRVSATSRAVGKLYRVTICRDAVAGVAKLVERANGASLSETKVKADLASRFRTRRMGSIK